MADSEGFEPSRRFPAYTLSRRAPSTTRPTVQCGPLYPHIQRLQHRISVNMQVYPPVLATFFLDLANPDRSDL